MSSSSWLRRGSSTVFDRHTLGPLIGSGTLVSLREALRWMNGWPSDPPGCPNIRFQVLCLSRHRSWNSPASRKRRNPLLEDDNQIHRGERLQLGRRALQTNGCRGCTDDDPAELIQEILDIEKDITKWLVIPLRESRGRRAAILIFPKLIEITEG